MLDDYLSAWELMPDGDLLVTASSLLLPVRFAEIPAMLKIATVDEEVTGNAVMRWWEGDGAAQVLKHDGSALLLERARGTRSLLMMEKAGQDSEVAQILCNATARLHTPRNSIAPPVTTLTQWFHELEPIAGTHGGILTRCVEAARLLLQNPCEEVVLHGDIHHGNVLNFGRQGWLAIDPKGLCGERGFDYANLFTNPDLETALRPGRIAWLADIVTQESGIERARLLMWVLAWAGLSAAWAIGSGANADVLLKVAEAVAAERDKAGTLRAR